MAKDNNVALAVKGLHKSFHLPTEASSGMKQALINFVKGVKGYREQQVIRDISFEVHKGDFLGIVGRNGSGKSTLLKLISGIYTPDKGTVEVNGVLVSFIELGVGFDSELTGRENVYLNGALFGFSNREMDDMYDEIVDFAELHEFMDQKLKNYSSGMQVRLAFAIAIQAKGDILVLDEVLAVGDEAFQKKCNDYFEKIKQDKSKTVILVTHGMDNVRRYCNKAMLVSGGVIKLAGSPDDVANQYSLENIVSFESHDDESTAIKISPVSKQVLRAPEPLEFEVEYTAENDTGLFVGISIWCEDVHLFSDDTIKMTTNKAGTHRFKYRFDTKGLGSGTIKVTATLYNAETRQLASYAKEGESSYYKIIDPNQPGLFARKGTWE